MAATPVHTSIQASSEGPTGLSENARRVALTVVTALFFMWGFLTCLNDILIPHLKSVFELNYVEASLIQFVFFGAYFIMSLPSGKKLADIVGVRHLLFVPAIFYGYIIYYGFSGCRIQP
jgi:fucose permease